MLPPIYSALPKGATRGMVVLHEIFGHQPEIERVVQRFAGAGWAAAAPNLFDKGFTCVIRAFREAATGRGPAIDSVRATRKWLAENAGIEESSIGLIGFCFGGGFALAAGAGFAAVSTNYGAIPKAEVMRGMGPVIGCYGERDKLFGKLGGKLKSRLAQVGVTPEVHTYPKVGHSFLTDGSHPVPGFFSRPFLHVEARDEAVRAQAWRDIFGFLEKNVRPSPAAAPAAR
jgi:carboxymethylenebutenolidase